jgi:hypothetical protein
MERSRADFVPNEGVSYVVKADAVQRTWRKHGQRGRGSTGSFLVARTMAAARPKVSRSLRN